MEQELKCVVSMQVSHRSGGDGFRSEQAEDDPARRLQGAGQGQIIGFWRVS